LSKKWLHGSQKMSQLLEAKAEAAHSPRPQNGPQLLAACGRRGGVAARARAGVLPGVSWPGAPEIPPRLAAGLGVRSSQGWTCNASGGEARAVGSPACHWGLVDRLRNLVSEGFWWCVWVIVLCERPREAERRRVSVLYRGRLCRRRPRVCWPQQHTTRNAAI